MQSVPVVGALAEGDVDARAAGVADVPQVVVADAGYGVVTAFRDALTAQIATDQRELAATTDQDRTRREFLAWRIKRVQNRITFIEIRLAAIRIEAP